MSIWYMSSSKYMYYLYAIAKHDIEKKFDQTKLFVVMCFKKFLARKPRMLHSYLIDDLLSKTVLKI